MSIKRATYGQKRCNFWTKIVKQDHSGLGEKSTRGHMYATCTSIFSLFTNWQEMWLPILQICREGVLGIRKKLEEEWILSCLRVKNFAAKSFWLEVWGVSFITQENELSKPSKTTLVRLVKSYQILSNLVKSYQILPNLVKYHQIFSNLVKSCQTLSNLVKSCQILLLCSILSSPRSLFWKYFTVLFCSSKSLAKFSWLFSGSWQFNILYLHALA